MIQETYNYLLTREQVIKLSAKDFIKQTKENNDFVDKLKMIRHIMNNENIFLMATCADNIQNWLQEFRFTYNKAPEISKLMNEIISITQVYKGLSISEKNAYIRDLLELEALRRNMIGHIVSENEVLSSILWDFTNFKYILDGIETNCFDNPDIEINAELLLYTVQMLRQQFPGIFEEKPELFDATIWLSKEIKKYSKDRLITKLAKEYIKQATNQMNKKNSNSSKRHIKVLTNNLIK